jgi:hypothetical protein
MYTCSLQAASILSKAKPAGLKGAARRQANGQLLRPCARAGPGQSQARLERKPAAVGRPAVAVPHRVARVGVAEEEAPGYVQGVSVAWGAYSRICAPWCVIMHGQAHTPLGSLQAVRPARHVAQAESSGAFCCLLAARQVPGAACPHDAASGPLLLWRMCSSRAAGAAPNVCRVLEAYDGHADQPPIPLADLVAALQDLRTPQPLRRNNKRCPPCPGQPFTGMASQPPRPGI